MNSLKIITTLICKIPPNLPLPVFDRKKSTKGRNYPSLAIFFLPHRQARGATCLREAASAKAGGRFSDDYVNPILRPLITLQPMPSIPYFVALLIWSST